MHTLLNASAPAPREYQVAIAKSVIENGSTLVVLPTGMGKTLIAMMVADKKLVEGRVLFLAPTRPLAAQHEKTFRDWLSLKDEDIALISGAISAHKRPEIYEKNPKVILSTPQTIANDLQGGRLKWDFSLVIFDEVHRAVGKYAYTKVAEQAKQNKALVLGLTASPGAQKKKIKEIMDALGIENVQIRVAEDADVKEYVKPLQISWIEVQLPAQMLEVKGIFEKMISERSNTLKKMGFYAKFNTKKSMAELRAKILASKSPLKYSALSYHATLFSLVHMLELFETQGVEATKKFIERLKGRDASKAQRRILDDGRFRLIEQKLQQCPEHPKLQKLVQTISAREKGEKFIVFSQYRDQVLVIEKELCSRNILAKSFMGKKDGITQKEQAKTIQGFREGKFDILVATSIGEEGLDIPSVDNVIFFEPVPSEIRAIQRRGRAGRAKLGRMIGLIAKGTRDEAFFWASKRREEKMKTIVMGLSHKGEKTDALSGAPQENESGRAQAQNYFAKKHEKESFEGKIFAGGHAKKMLYGKTQGEINEDVDFADGKKNQHENAQTDRSTGLEMKKGEQRNAGHDANKNPPEAKKIKKQSRLSDFS